MNWQGFKDRLAFPLLAFISPERARGLGLTPVEDERLLVCLRYARGRLLDVGCGTNQLVQRYGSGVGVDVYPWHGIDVLCDTGRLPFPDAVFHTVTMAACLNHIPRPQRLPVLAEVHRVLRPDGQLLVTMLDPIIGRITHRVREGVDPDQQVRGIHQDEDLGLWSSEVRRLLEESGFRVEWRKRFVFGLNNVYRATRAL